MADIFSIFSGTKIGSADVEVRFQECQKNIQQQGFCNCAVCLKKAEVVYNLLALAHKELFQFMKDTKTNIYFEDILDTLLKASREVYTHISRNDNGQKEK